MTIELAPETEAWISREAEDRGIAPEDLARKMLDDRVAHLAGVSDRIDDSAPRTPAEMLIGLFSDPEDAALLDEVTAMAYEGRRTATTREIGL